MRGKTSEAVCGSMFLLKVKEDYPWPDEIHPLPKCPTITCETPWEMFLTDDSDHFLMKLKESRKPEVTHTLFSHTSFCVDFEKK